MVPFTLCKPGARRFTSCIMHAYNAVYVSLTSSSQFNYVLIVGALKLSSINVDVLNFTVEL